MTISNHSEAIATTPEDQNLIPIHQPPQEQQPSREFSVFHSCAERTPSCSITLKNFVTGIRDGLWRAEVEKCRSSLKESGKKAYNELREKITTAVTLSGRFEHRRKSATLEQKGAIHSGLIQLDFDAKDHEDMTVSEIRQIVEQAPFVAACFLSLSGDGIKAIGLCSASFQMHAGSWHAADGYFKERGLTLDPATKDASRLCFVSYDQDALIRDDAEEIAPIELPEPSTSHESSNGTEDPEHVHKILANLAEKIGPYQKRPIWIHIVASTVDAVGEEAAGEIIDEYFPPERPEDESAGDVARGLTGSWLSLRKYGIDPVNYLRLLPDLPHEPEQPPEGVRKQSLREQAYDLRFDPNKTPPPEETCMMIGDVPIAARGNLSVIQGKSKVGKSAVVSAILGATQRGQVQNSADTLCMEWKGIGTGAIIHLDTEQSRADWHGLVSRGIERSGLPVSNRLVSLQLVLFTRSERMEVLRQTLEYEREQKGAIDAVIIDGIADLCKSPNDEMEALEIVSRIMAHSQEFNTPIFCVLHENPGSDQGKTRGHLGSELNRKAFANLRIDKNAETGVSTIYGMDMRKRDIPKEHGFCFAWNDAVRMHTFRGRATGLKAAEKVEKAQAKTRLEWERIFESAKSGTNGDCPSLTSVQAVDVLRDMPGTGETVTEDAMKKRMQRAENLGVLRKTGTGTWTLMPLGQSGQEWDI